MTQTARFPARQKRFATNGRFVAEGRDIGTFKDSLRAPIHRWFKYPAGYSYKLVREAFKAFDIRPGNWILDPFSGSGTTLIEAKKASINSIGIEAHFFVHWVAETKLFWEFNLGELHASIQRDLHSIKQLLEQGLPTSVDLSAVFPPLVHKCYSPEVLAQLYLFREYIVHDVEPSPYQNLLKLALTDILRTVSSAGTGWPYIAPNKRKQTQYNVYTAYEDQLWLMYQDLATTIGLGTECETLNTLGDTRERLKTANGEDLIPDAMVDLAITSPPYLNNYDYADRTRLELYFFGLATTWGEITEKVRDELMIAATTQIRRREFDPDHPLSDAIKDCAPGFHEELTAKIKSLSERRLKKGGRKDYDFMVAGYFNDMYQTLIETARMLKAGGTYLLVLGDSAPYGVYIPTDEYLGRLACAVGFEEYRIEELRKRGGKWKKNPQRHKVPLHEALLILRK
jgi:DNA modification methylase